MSLRNMDDLNLRNAFAPMPDKCRDALMNAALSTKKENTMKRASFRVVLIAAIIIVATIMVALAAGQLGLNDLFTSFYRTTLPESAKNVLAATEQKAYAVGPLTITLCETLADGRVVYANTRAMPADGTPALIQMSNGDLSMGIPDSEAARLNVPKGTSFLNAAKQAGVPLYTVSSYMTIDGAYIDGQEMRDILWSEDGSALFVDMLTTNPNLVRETLTGILTLRVREINADKGGYIEDKDWKTKEEITIPVNGVTAEKTYLPENEAQLSVYTVKSVKAEQTCAGTYLTATLTARDGVLATDVWMLDNFVRFADAQGVPFALGMNLSSNLGYIEWPNLVWEFMVSADALPESIKVIYEDDTVTLK